MLKLTATLLASLLALLSATATASAQSGTTRIEPRPYIGAIVTIEQGVRVFRPLPPTNRVIINPHGATPLSLGFNETHSYHRSDSTVRSYHRHSYDGGYLGGRCIPAVGGSC